MRNGGPWIATAGAAGLLTLIFSGCAAAPPPEPVVTQTPPASAAREPIVVEPLSCDDLLSIDDVARALTAADGTVSAPVPAVQPSTDLADHITTAAGGLSCSWRVGEPQSSTMTSTEGEDWVYLAVKVFPGSGEAWKAWALADGGHEDLTTIDGIDVVSQCSDPGCNIEAAAGDASISVTMRAAGWGTGRSRFEGSYDTVAGRLEAAAGTVINRIQSARENQIAWPRLDTGARSHECDGALNPIGIAAAMGVDTVSYERQASNRAGTPAALVGLYTCRVITPRDEPVLFTQITVGRGLAPVLATLEAEPDTSTALEPVALENAVEGEQALIACADTSDYCSLLFSIGHTAYQVQSRGNAIAIAEAMIAQSR